MGWSEAGSDTGEETGRGSAVVRGSITGGMTVLGEHLPHAAVPDLRLKKALIVAGVVVAVELFAIAWIRNRFLDVPMRSSLVFITVGGVISLAIGVGSEPLVFRWPACRPDARRARWRASGRCEAAERAKTHWYTGFFASSERRKEVDEMRAVDAVMECLKAEGVEVVFGLPGGANLPTYDAFVNGGLRHILVRHEAGGGHAAEGYAKATGKVGVAFATSGPGATNLITPICDAMMDSVPVVFITGQVRTELLGTDGFQEADTIGITMPVVKHSFMITRPQEIPRAIHEAFHIARSGRPGPVLVDIPQDLSRAEIDYEPVTDLRLPGYQPRVEGNQKQIRQAAKALAAAQRPVIYAGGGVVNAEASAELVEFATSDRFPVTCTLMGLGAAADRRSTPGSPGPGRRSWPGKGGGR